MAIRLDVPRYPRACHLICLKVGGEQDGLEGESSSMSPNAGIRAAAGAGELQTSSRGQGRAMHGQRMVEWLQVREILVFRVLSGSLHRVLALCPPS